MSGAKNISYIVCHTLNTITFVLCTLNTFDCGEKWVIFITIPCIFGIVLSVLLIARAIFDLCAPQDIKEGVALQPTTATVRK
jgi:hypothetical protein